MEIREFLSGGIAGVMVDFVVYPLDTAKTRIHREMALEKNVSALYRGLRPALVFSVPCTGTFWASNRAAKMQLKNYGLTGACVEAFSAVFASFMTSVVRCPSERVKQIMQSGGEKAGGIEVGMKIVKNEGIVGLYRGFRALCYRDMPFDIIQMLIYNALKKKWGDSDMGTAKSFLCGGIAGGLTACLTSPIDLVKTRIMTLQEKRTVLQILIGVSKTKGLRGLFRGSFLRVFNITIGGMMFFGVHDSVLDYFGKPEYD